MLRDEDTADGEARRRSTSAAGLDERLEGVAARVAKVAHDARDGALEQVAHVARGEAIERLEGEIAVPLAPS